MPRRLSASRREASGSLGRVLVLRAVRRRNCMSEGAAPSDSVAPTLEVRELRKHFPAPKGVFSRNVGVVRAVDDISFSVQRGKTLGLVGDSGCGKSTAGKAVLKLIEPTSGT